MKKFYEHLCFAELLIAQVFMIIMVVLIFVAGFARLVGHPINWSIDIATCVFAWACFLSADIAWRKGKLMCVDVIVKRLSESGQRLFRMVNYAIVIAFLLYLAVAIVKSNLQMAVIVSRPKLAIRPGIVRIKTRLQSPIGRLVLANAITLTPGTLTVDAQGEDLFIHWVNVETEDVDSATREIAAGFERYLEVIFG